MKEGTDKNGRKIGFGVRAECDAPGCNKLVNRGVAFACGTKHGEGKYCCDKYFCSRHLHYYKDPDGNMICVCSACRKEMALRIIIGDYNG